MECATKDAQIDEEIKVSNGTPPSTFKVLIPKHPAILPHHPKKSCKEQ